MIDREFTEKEVVRLTKDMVSIRSYSFMENQEAEISKYILDFFVDHGIKAYRKEIVPGRFNTFAIIEGCERETSPSLLLTGHMDTVPAYDFADAFDPVEDDTYIYGRGSCDMKGPLAAMMCAISEIKKKGIRLKGDLAFCGVADEEEAGIGTEDLIKTGPECTYSIIGEPTDLKIDLGHKGLEWIEITFKGVKKHGGAQSEAVNAINMAGRFLHKLETEYLPELRTRKHPLLGEATLNVGTIRGGDQPSTVPDICVMRLDRRCITSETIEQVYSELQDIADELHAEDPRFVCEIKDVFNGETLPHIPFCIDETEPIVVASERAIKNTGREPILSCFPAWSDAGFMAAGTNSKCIIMGPGDLSVAHSTAEKIEKKALYDAASIYYDIALEICGVKND